MSELLDEAPVAELPPGWESTTLGAIAPAEYGKGLTAKARRPGPVSVLASAGVVGEHDEALVDDGDIIVVGRKGAAGRVTLARGPAWIIDTAYFIRVPETINAKFLAFKLQAAGLEALDQSTAIPSLSRDDLHRVEIALPPLDEQERIVETIEGLSGQIADAVGLLRRALDGIADLRRSILARPFASYYPRVRVSEVGEVVLGFTPSRKSPALWGGDIPWVSSGEVAFRRITATRESIAQAALGKRDLNPPGTVLVAMYGEGKTRGQAAILGIEAVTNQAVAAIRLNPDMMLPEFLYQCLMHEYAAIRAVAQGGQQPNLNGEMVRSIRIPLPPLIEQRAIVDAAEIGLGAADQMDLSLRATLADAEALRTSILRDALAGKFPQDANA